MLNTLSALTRQSVGTWNQHFESCGLQVVILARSLHGHSIATRYVWERSHFRNPQELTTKQQLVEERKRLKKAASEAAKAEKVARHVSTAARRSDKLCVHEQV